MVRRSQPLRQVLRRRGRSEHQPHRDGDGAEVNRRDARELSELIQRFLDGEQTEAVAPDIEGLVIECFQDEPWFEEASEALALFAPGGSTPYLDEAGLARELALVAAELTAALRDGRDG